MRTRFFQCLMILCLVVSGGSRADADESAVHLSAEDHAMILIGFAHRGYFSERGIAISPFDVAKIAREMIAKSGAEKTVPLPRFEEILAEGNTAQNADAELDWAWLEGNLRTPPDNPTAEYLASEIATFGLIVLFQSRYDSLFEKPLSQRTDLKSKISALVREGSAIHQGLFTLKGGPLREARLSAFKGTLRRLSVDIDLTIIDSLSPKERLSLAGLILPLTSRVK
ncbi:MAG: hypothetical protein AAF802_06895 [Planctomycetota bacterium]